MEKLQLFFIFPGVRGITKCVYACTMSHREPWSLRLVETLLEGMNKVGLQQLQSTYAQVARVGYLGMVSWIRFQLCPAQPFGGSNAAAHDICTSHVVLV